ncbi:MAG: hypothetical protein ABH864_02545 [archaeon]
MKNKNHIQICPQCGSPDIKTDFSNHAAVVRGFFNVMKCNHCSHEGTFFPTVEKNKLKKPPSIKEVKNVKHFDKTFAKGSFRTEFGALAIFFGIIGMAMILYPETRSMSVYSLVLALICLVILMISIKTNTPENK